MAGYAVLVLAPERVHYMTKGEACQSQTTKPSRTPTSIGSRKGQHEDLPDVLTAQRPPDVHHRVVIRWFQRFNWDQALIGIIALLHLWAAVTLTFAPHSQLFTQGTRPVFALFPPAGWAVAFLVGGFATAQLTRSVTGVGQFLTWLTVLPTQSVWLGASVIAVTHGGGSAMGVVFLSAVWLFTAVTAIRVAVDYTSGKR